MAELSSLDALGGVEGDTFNEFQLEIRYEDGVYLWKGNEDATTLLPSDVESIYNIGFRTEVPEIFSEFGNHIPNNATSFTYFQGDMTKAVPPSLLLTPTSIFYTSCDFSSPEAVLPSVPEGTDTLFYYIRVPRTVGSNSWGLSAPHLNDVGTTFRNGRDFRRIIFERNEMTSEHQISLIQSLEREILEGMGQDYLSTADNVRWLDFASNSSGANDPIDVAALEALGWAVVNATTMNKVINGDTWQVFHN